MLTLKMLIHQPAIDGLQLRINAAGNPRHARHLFHHHRVVYRLVGVFAPQMAVLIDDDPGVCSGLASPSVSIITCPVFSS